jgi:hypothetical protein
MQGHWRDGSLFGIPSLVAAWIRTEKTGYSLDIPET